MIHGPVSVHGSPGIGAGIASAVVLYAGQGTAPEVDSEFRGLFGAGDGTADGSADLDLNLEDFGGEDFISPDSAAEATFPDTEFLLPTDDESTDSDLDDSLLAGGGDEMQTKLDLAQAYVDMGDTDGARALLGEVVAGGDKTQKKTATQMLDGLS